MHLGSAYLYDFNICIESLQRQGQGKKVYLLCYCLQQNADPLVARYHHQGSRAHKLMHGIASPPVLIFSDNTFHHPISPISRESSARLCHTSAVFPQWTRLSTGSNTGPSPSVSLHVTLVRHPTACSRQDFETCSSRQTRLHHSRSLQLCECRRLSQNMMVSIDA